VVGRFLEALRARDFDGIGACFDTEALLLAVVPPGSREDTGPEEIAARYRRWLDDGVATVQDAEASLFADVTRIRYVVAAEGATIFEQAAYAEIENDRIVRLRVACSGRRPL
jgi:hypothetical protein